MHRRRAFTLVELLVVVALIGVLAALLLSALSSAQQRARATQTTSTMEAFAAACETFFQDHGEYPGVVPDALLMANLDNNGIPPISSLENALYHLMGGYLIEGVDENFPRPENAGWSGILDFGSGFRIQFALNSELIGNGPRIGGRQYPSYFTPPEGTLIKTFGQAGGGPNLLDIADAWGQPLILLRKQRTIGLLPNNSNTGGSPSSWQFRTEGIAPYVESNNLGDLRKQQRFTSTDQPSSVLSAAGNNAAFYRGNIGRLLANSAIQDTDGFFSQARGAMLLISGGPDGIYFSSWDGPGDPADPIYNWEDLDEFQQGNQPLTEAALGEYDDILRFIGS
jgi:prepilin-type N-terminal cleavage/methylation domain-containing protein